MTRLLTNTLAVSALAGTLVFSGCGKAVETADTESGFEIESPDPPNKRTSGFGWPLVQADAHVASPAILGAGDALAVRTTSTLSTKSAGAGETFVAYLEQPLVDGERTIAPTGAQVVGRVTSSDPGGRLKGVARMAVELIEFEAANGERIAIRTTSYAVRANKTHTKDAQKIGIGAGVGAAIGAIAGGGGGALKGAGVGAGAGTGAVLATRGAAAVIPAESVLRFELREEVSVDL